MTPLYELSADYQNLARLAADTVDPAELQAFTDTLAGLEGEISVKVLNCAAVIRNLLAEEEAIANEVDRLRKRAEALENARNRLKTFMQAAMEAANLDKIKGDLFTVALQNNPARTVVTDEAAVPDSFKKTSVVIQTGEIGKALKAGVEVAGAHLETSRSLRIR